MLSLLLGQAVYVRAEDLLQGGVQQKRAEQEGSQRTDTQQEEWQQEEWLLEEMDLQAAEEALREMTAFSDFSFLGLIKDLMTGNMAWDLREIGQAVQEILFTQLAEQKELALRILVIALVSAVISNFIRIFENHAIAEISFYMMYLLITTLLVHSFQAMGQIVAEALQSLASFMNLLLPAYLVTIVFTAGGVTALGFYQLTVLAIHILTGVIIRIVLPLIQLYMALLILNQMTREDCFSQFASLLRTVVEWTVRTAVGITAGLQAVQCLISPAVDSLKNSAVHRLAKVLPGIGNLMDAAAETVLGSALVIKNAVGVAGMIAIAAICLVPFLKLAVNILLFRVLCALLQPVSEKRMVDCIAGISESSLMLMRVLLSGMAMFVISLALITASVKGG